MKKNIFKNSLAFILLFGILNFSNAQQKALETSNKSEVLETTLKKEDIISWLQRLIKSNTKVRNKFIEDILQNALFDEMYLERSSPGENGKIAIVPLKKVYFSQHINKEGKKPIQNLVVDIDRDNKTNLDKIFVINLSLFYPTDTRYTSMPKYAFSNFFNQSYTLDGTYTLVSIFLGDSKYTEMIVKNGERMQHKSWRYKKMNNVPDSSSRMWYLETTDIIKDADGKLTFKTKTEELGISNTVSPPKYKGDLRTKEYDK